MPLVWFLATFLVWLAPVKSETQGVLQVVLRDSHGQPLGGVSCEILSYDWGRKLGEPFAVIAQGVTDTNGQVAFAVSDWPRTGYRFRFRATEKLTPASTFIVPESENQYRGYPAAVVGGTLNQTERFFIGSDGLAYNDLSLNPTDNPRADRDPVGGLEKPRLTVVPAAEFLATAQARAASLPTPTLPPPPPVRSPGYIQPALSQTVAPAEVEKEIVPVPATTPPPNQANNQKPTSGSFESSLLLGSLGLVSLILFWIYRPHLYRLLGLPSKPDKNSKPGKRPKQ